MTPITRFVRLFSILIACCCVTARAQNTVFNAALAGDSLNTTIYPNVTATTTGWDVLSNKAAPVPAESGGVLTINMAGTGSGYVETQALFSPSAVQLLPNTYIEFTATFMPTFILTNPGDVLTFGFFNSGGSAPLNGLLNTGLVGTSTTFGTGGAQNWLGYNATIPLTGSSSKMTTRPAQAAGSNLVQDVVLAPVNSSVGYSNGVNASSVGSLSTTLTNGSTYTLDYKLSLSADGLTLTAAVSLYNGTGTTGTGANTLIGSYTGKFTGAAMVTKAFNALAFGWRADSGTSNPSNLKISALTVKTTGGAPWFTTQPPSSILVSIGDDLNLTATAAGIVTSYQWQVSTDGTTFTNLDTAAIPSAATTALTIANVQNSTAGFYRVLATNAAGSTASTPCTVSVSATPVAPSFLTNPANATVLGGTSQSFTVTVNGTSPLSYQWEKSTDGVTFVPVAGATNATYTIPAVSLSDEGYYHVTVTNVAGSATSTAAQLVVNQPLTITAQPVGVALNLGDSTTLSVTAVGKPAPTYQWYLNGTLIAGATNSTYTIASAAAANAGIYTVVASNMAGDSVTSSGAAVAVLSPTLTTTALTPTATPTGVAPDSRLTLTFNQPISIGLMGTIKIFDASNPSIPVDTIDLVTATALMKTLRAASTFSTQAMPVQNKTIGGVTNFNYYPITVSGNTATIYPRNNVLAYNKTYFVTIDAGVLTDSSGLAYAGISGNAGWTFSTRTVGLATSATKLVVAADGSGDFCTVQAALDFIPAGNTTPRTIFIRKGTYFEEIYFTAKHSLTFLGEDRAQTLIVYPNNNNFNNVSGVYHRMVFNADKANNVALVNLSVTNSTPKGGAQAEAVILNGTTTAQAIISNVTLFSYQDTLQINGQGYVTDSRISGDVDFMWGSGPCFFNNCELTQLTSGGYFTQIRNGSAGHGYVFSNCRFNAPAGVTGSYLGRIDPASNQFPYSEVVVLDSKFGDGTNNAFLATATGVSGSSNYAAGWWLLNNVSNTSTATNVHNWTNNLINGNGAALANPNADAFTTMPLDATTQANYRNVSWVLGNSWTPILPPLIATSPVAQTVDVGTGFTLSVQAFGFPTLTYQWLRNGIAIGGATGASYIVANSSAGDAGTYSVIVSNGTTSVTTAAVSLVVHGAPPVILLQPANTAGLLGATATLNGWAVGDGPFTYQWLKDGAPIVGATKQSLRLTGLQASDAGGYAVAITNAGGTTTSASAALSLVAPATTMPTLPQIPAGIYDVTAYGAIGDGATDNTAAIQAAINAAKAAGGGTIELPPASGAYLSGPITLSSYLNLQINAGATLRALPFGVYPNSKTAPTHFITISSASTDVEFSGGGTIDGDGAAWWAAYDAGTITGRPRLVQINKSSNMLFTGITCLNSPNFNLAFSGANNNVTLFGVTVTAPGTSSNTDGMDLAGTNFLVQSCSVSVGDDNIVAKPGSVFCRNIYIANCAIGTGHGVSIGGQTNVGLDGMVVTNCTFNGTSSALRFKADPTQGGPVQNVTFSNLTMTNVQYPILFYSYYNVLGSPGAISGSSQITPAKVNTYNTSPPNSLSLPTIPTWKNIIVTNLTVTNASGYCTIWGLPTADALIANVTLNNVNIQGGAGLELYNASNIQLTGTSSVGSIITCNALGITGQPTGKTINVGQGVSFSATAVGGSGTNNTGLTYQWKLNGTSLTDGVQADGSTISGVTTATLAIANARVTGAGDYTVTVSTNLDGYNTSTSTLVANSLPVSATSSAATLIVNPLAATISLADLTQTYDGTPKSATATTSPGGLPVQFTYDGSATPPTNVGSYVVAATIADPNYVGSASDTLSISKATPVLAWSTPAAITYGTPLGATQLSATASTAGVFEYTPAGGTVLSAGANQPLSAVFTPADTANFVSGGNVATTITVNQATADVSLGNLVQTYNGSPRSVTVTTAPAGLAVDVTYAGSATPPTAAGSYAIVATVNDANYVGSKSGTLLVSKATATISLAPLTQTYDGTPKVVTATTVPAGLTVIITYDSGSATASIYPGAHPVSATISDANYQGTLSETLNIGVTALIRHSPTIDGILAGSIQVLSAESILLDSTATISGDLLVLGTPTVNVNGRATLGSIKTGPGAAAPTNYSVTLAGNAVARAVVRHVDAILLPTVTAPAAPSGTRSVTLTKSTDSAGAFATLGDLTLNPKAGRVIVPAGTYGNFVANGSSSFVFGTEGATVPTVYNLQNLTLNDSSKLEIVGPVVLTLANGATLYGVAGNTTHPSWFELRIASGGLTLNLSAQVHGRVVAPGGTVSVNDDALLDGTVAADRLTIEDSAELSN